MQISNTIHVPAATGIALNRKGTRAYVRFFSTIGLPLGGVEVVDLQSGAILAGYSLPLYGGPTGIAVAPDESVVYLTDQQQVFVIEPATGVYQTYPIPIPESSAYYSIALLPDGSQLVISSNGVQNQIAIFDTAQRIMKTVTVPGAPYQVFAGR